jgi:hypothetical protein
MGGSGFYGPMNSGAALTHNPTAAEMKAAEQALDAVRKGSNKIEYRTDQGMAGDPNFAREMNDPQFRMKKIDGAWFADHPMFNRKGGKWAERQRKADAEQPTTQTLKPGPGGTLRPSAPEQDWSKATPKDVAGAPNLQGYSVKKDEPAPSMRSGDYMNRSDEKFKIDETSAYKSLAKPPSGVAPKGSADMPIPPMPTPPPSAEPSTVSNSWHGHHHRIGKVKHSPEREPPRDGSAGYGDLKNHGDYLCHICNL